MASALATRYATVTLGGKTFPYDAAQFVLSEQRDAKKSSAINQTIAQKVWAGESLGIIEYEGKSYFLHPISAKFITVNVSLDTTDSWFARHWPSWCSDYSKPIVEAMKAQGIKFSASEFEKLDKTWNISPCDKCTKEPQRNLIDCMTAPNSCLGNKGSTKVHAQRMNEMLPINIQQFRRTLEGQWAKKVIAEVNHANSRKLPADYDFAKQTALRYEPQRVVARYPKCDISKEFIKCKEELVLVALVKFDPGKGEFYKQWSYASKTAVRKELSKYDPQSELWRAIEAKHSSIFSDRVKIKKFQFPSSAMEVIKCVDSGINDNMPHVSFYYPAEIKECYKWDTEFYSCVNGLTIRMADTKL